jgi:hypothetical protein
MSDMQQSAQSAAMMSSAFEAAPAAFDDFDYALGCECADPALQIERWSQEASGQEAT